MKTWILLLFLILVKTDMISAQSDSLLNMYRKITYYDNGLQKKLVTYLNDSCGYTDDYGNPGQSDYCREGFYQEWYSNGQTKTSGQYKYKWFHDSIVVADPISGLLDTTIISYKSSVKTGLWDSFDSCGNRLSISRYVDNKLITTRHKSNDTTLSVTYDSIWIKIADYSTYTAYQINRSKNNKYLFLQFPTHEIHNYWKIYNYKIDLLHDDFPTSHLFLWDKSIADLVADDCCGDNCKYYHDFASLPAGRYYVYYWSFHGIFHEIEIVLNDI